MEYFDGWAQIGVFDVESKTFSIYDAGFEARMPSFSPDGKSIAYVRGGDVFLFDLASKQSRRLTKNPWRERYPMFSDDGARVYFESQGDDPLFERRTISLVGSVAVKDAGEPGADAAEENQQ
jgi:Tol biopolymer transport system component